jgi:hypothetical protein
MRARMQTLNFLMKLYEYKSTINALPMITFRNDKDYDPKTPPLTTITRTFRPYCVLCRAEQTSAVRIRFSFGYVHAMINFGPDSMACAVL